MTFLKCISKFSLGNLSGYRYGRRHNLDPHLFIFELTLTTKKTWSEFVRGLTTLSIMPTYSLFIGYDCSLVIRWKFPESLNDFDNIYHQLIRHTTACLELRENPFKCCHSHMIRTLLWTCSFHCSYNWHSTLDWYR